MTTDHYTTFSFQFHLISSVHFTVTGKKGVTIDISYSSSNPLLDREKAFIADLVKNHIGCSQLPIFVSVVTARMVWDKLRMTAIMNGFPDPALRN